MTVSHLQEQQLLWCDGVSSLYRREQNRGTQRYGTHYLTHLHMPMKTMVAACFGVGNDSRSSTGT